MMNNRQLKAKNGMNIHCYVIYEKYVLLALITIIICSNAVFKNQQ